MLSKEESAINTINQLSFFAPFSCIIEPIFKGLSQLCFKVTATHNITNITSIYFVKSIAAQQVNMSNEVISASLSVSISLSPDVVFHCSNWLITEFVEGNSLFERDMEMAKKIDVAVSALQKFHTLTPANKMISVSIEEIIDTLINNEFFLASQKMLLQSCKEKVITFEPSVSKVLCHGDANFSNFLIDQDNKCWLIDFECSFIGDAEFDIAMFIAINNLLQIPLNPIHLAQAIKCYSAYSDYVLDEPLIYAYLACCYLINGMWYHAQMLHAKNNVKFLELARQQYQCFDQLGLCEFQLEGILY